ncbi:adenosylcobinamide-GDP ribazoletransferase [Smaragdicoccus niigatensis]|uniref:adenosylcobinamide-GDP ribazoletransferase n=1 Tax=Smaragdicoccus niigatensis TaxID=359359 RepID=UPI0003804599|nr:adenosylcobinamide-GDP ribazoletransferase [Smaragdicoccus niigatensis]
MNSVRLAFTWLTVLPIRGPATVDRTNAGRAISLAPIVGLVLGAGAGLVWCLMCLAGSAPIVAGFVVVAFLTLATRAMHLDGLSDTFDALGTYGTPERAREVMKSGPAGPFGIVAIVLAIALQATGFAQLEPIGIGLAVVAGRVAVVAACLRGVSPVPTDGFGSLVASTQSRWIAAAWFAVLCGASVLLSPFAPIVVVVAAAVGALFVRHCVRRLGSVGGDVLGALTEVTVAITAVGFSLF